MRRLLTIAGIGATMLGISLVGTPASATTATSATPQGCIYSSQCRGHHDLLDLDLFAVLDLDLDLLGGHHHH